MTVLEAIKYWVENYKDKQFKLRVAGSIASFIGSLPVLFLTYWCVWFVLSFAFHLSGVSLFVGTMIIIVLLFVAYLTANYEELENLKFGDPQQSRRVRQFARATGRGYMSVFANQETFHSFVKILSVSILAGPALVMTGVRLARAAIDLIILEPEFVAPILIKLAKAGKRIPMEKLAAELRDRPLADRIDQMALIDGVVVRTEGASGMYLTEDLQSTLASQRDKRR